MNQICTYCVMDTSDPEIAFDARGECNHCREARVVAARRRQQSAGERAKLLEAMVSQLKRAGRDREFDCIIGVSGGVDSSYVARMTRDLGLRALAVHLDNGWDDMRAVQNIKKLLDAYKIPLTSVILDWTVFRELQRSFLFASTPDAEVPSDHIISASLFKVAAERGVRTILLGTNEETESILPRTWSQGHQDWRYISSVHASQSRVRIAKLPHVSFLDRYVNTYVRGIRLVPILEYVEYDKAKAVAVLAEEVGWTAYGHKHNESIYTRFYQNYFLPTKFGYDKRRAHLSSLIVAGKVSRADALTELEKPIYASEEELRIDRQFVLKKLGFSESEFEAIMAKPPRRFEDFPSYAHSPVHRFLQRSAYRLLAATKPFRS